MGRPCHAGRKGSCLPSFQLPSVLNCGGRLGCRTYPLRLFTKLSRVLFALYPISLGAQGDAFEAIFFARPAALGYVGTSPAGRSPFPW